MKFEIEKGKTTYYGQLNVNTKKLHSSKPNGKRQSMVSTKNTINTILKNEY